IIDIAKPNDKKREDYRYKRVYSKKYGIDTENDLQTEVREQVTKAIADLKNWEKKLLIKLQQNKKWGIARDMSYAPFLTGIKECDDV
uniref:hypothetical protein n=1 Tax=Gemmiger formicilis TaxID=745368 RepID=UPI004028425C